MKLKDKIRTKQTIRATGQKVGVSTEQCREEMQQAIDIAWATTDPAAKDYQEQLFPAGKPTVEEFIAVLSSRVQNTTNDEGAVRHGSE